MNTLSVSHRYPENFDQIFITAQRLRSEYLRSLVLKWFSRGARAHVEPARSIGFEDQNVERLSLA